MWGKRESKRMAISVKKFTKKRSLEWGSGQVGPFRQGLATMVSVWVKKNMCKPNGTKQRKRREEMIRRTYAKEWKRS